MKLNKVLFYFLLIVCVMQLSFIYSSKRTYISYFKKMEELDSLAVNSIPGRREKVDSIFILYSEIDSLNSVLMECENPTGVDL
ncbi:hypothetical protein BGP76_18950 [Reichenbachiella sp. MSK19-1]|nr:hypothetical protein BGP76_18950 [Reichenbachiella sp. MSK19-1]